MNQAVGHCRRNHSLQCPRVRRIQSPQAKSVSIHHRTTAAHVGLSITHTRTHTHIHWNNSHIFTLGFLPGYDQILLTLTFYLDSLSVSGPFSKPLQIYGASIRNACWFASIEESIGVCVRVC